MIVFEPFEPVFFGGLPVEVVAYILQFCGLETFPALSQVSRTFYSMTHDSWLINKVAPHAYNAMHLYHRALWKHLVAWVSKKHYSIKATLTADDMLKRSQANKHWKSIEKVKTASAKAKHLKAALDIEYDIVPREVAFVSQNVRRESYSVLTTVIGDFPAKWFYDRKHCDLPTMDQWKQLQKVLIPDRHIRSMLVYAVMTADYELFNVWFNALKRGQRKWAFEIVAQVDSVDLVERLHIDTYFWAGPDEYKELFQSVLKHRSPNLVKWFLDVRGTYSTITFDILGFEALVAREWNPKEYCTKEFVDQVLERKIVSELEAILEKPGMAKPFQDVTKITIERIMEFPHCMGKAQAMAWAFEHIENQHVSQVIDMLQALDLTWNDLWVMAANDNNENCFHPQHKIFQLSNGDICNENARQHVYNMFTDEWAHTEDIIKAVKWADKIDGCDPIVLLAQTINLQRCSLTAVIKRVRPSYYERLMDEALESGNAKCISSLILDLCYVPTEEQIEKSKKAGKTISQILKKARSRLILL
jgi:hypothetical protein